MYYLFTGQKFYPRGGAKDFHGIFDEKEDALHKAFEVGDDWYQIAVFDNGKLVIIREGTR